MYTNNTGVKMQTVYYDPAACSSLAQVSKESVQRGLLGLRALQLCSTQNKCDML